MLLVLWTPEENFPTGINNTSGTGGKLAVGIVDISAKFDTGIKTNGNGGTGVVDTDGKFATGVVDSGGKFGAGVADTSGKFSTGVVDTGGASKLANMSTNFRKNSKSP